MKKILSLIMVVALLCAAVSALVSCGDNADVEPDATTTTAFDPLAADVPVDEGYGLNGATANFKLADGSDIYKYKELADGTIAITGTYIERVNEALLGELSGKLVVPAVIDGKKVSTLGETALAALVNLQEVVLPDYIVKIDHYALRGCAKLTTIKFPQYVRTLGDGVFTGCAKLTAIDFLPATVTAIGDRAFDSCTNILKVVLPDSVTTIGEYSFVGCTNLGEVVLSNNLTSIPDRMFMGCSKIGKSAGSEGFTMVIPSTVTSIGDYAFEGCSSITAVAIPDGVTSIGEKAFSGCRRIAAIVLPESVKSIGNEAFATCQSLKAITFPSAADVVLGADLLKTTNKNLVITAAEGSAARAWCIENGFEAKLGA